MTNIITIHDGKSFAELDQAARALVVLQTVKDCPGPFLHRPKSLLTSSNDDGIFHILSAFHQDHAAFASPVNNPRKPRVLSVDHPKLVEIDLKSTANGLVHPVEYAVTSSQQSARNQQRAYQAKVNVDMSHTFSKTWMSARAVEYEKFLSKKAAIERTYRPIHDPKMPIAAMVPITFDAWLAHREAMVEYRRKKFEKFMEKQKETKRAAAVAKLVEPFGGKKFVDNKSAVLARPTIWCANFHVAERWAGEVWPTREEYEYEGDERVKSGVSRYLPMLRARHSDNNTVKWSILLELPMLEFDEVRKKPTYESIHVQVEEVDDEDISQLLNKDLLVAIAEEGDI